MKKLRPHDAAGNGRQQYLVGQVGIHAPELEFPLEEKEGKIEAQAEHRSIAADGDEFILEEDGEHGHLAELLAFPSSTGAVGFYHRACD